MTSPRRHLVPGVPWGFPRTWFGDTCSQCAQCPFRGALVCLHLPLFPSPELPTRAPTSSAEASVSLLWPTFVLPFSRPCSIPAGWSGRCSPRQRARPFKHMRSSLQLWDLNTFLHLASSRCLCTGRPRRLPPQVVSSTPQHHQPHPPSLAWAQLLCGSAPLLPPSQTLPTSHLQPTSSP